MSIERFRTVRASNEIGGVESSCLGEIGSKACKANGSVESDG